MTKTELLKLKKRIDLLLAKATEEALNDGENITSKDFESALLILKTRLLEERGITIDEYNQMMSEINTEKKETRKAKQEEHNVLLKNIKEIRGDPGKDGKDGGRGEKGDVGEQGDRGKQGIQGLVGATGAKGSKGDRGFKGDTGKVDITIVGELKKDIIHVQEAVHDIRIPEIPDWGEKMKDLEWRIENINTKRASIFNRSDAGSFNTAISDSRYYKKSEVDALISVENLFDRTGTTLIPHNAGDSLRVDGGLGVGVAPTSNIGYGAVLTVSEEGAFGYGTHNNVTASGSSAKGYGMHNYLIVSGGTARGYGVYNYLSSSESTNQYLYGTLNSIAPHAASVTAYGEYIISSITTINNPTVEQIGYYVNWRIAGTDTGNKKWALYNASTNTTAGKMFMGIDDVKTYWGTGYDWSISASADAQANLNITREVGTGYVDFGASPILTTGTLGAGAITGTGLTIDSNTVNLSDTTDGYVLAFDTATQTWRGVAGGGGSQTPWTSNIDGAGYNLSNVGTLSAGAITGTSGRFDGGVGVGVAPASNIGYGATLTAGNDASGYGVNNNITASGSSAFGFGARNYITTSGSAATGYGAYNTVIVGGAGATGYGERNTIMASGESNNQILYGEQTYLNPKSVDSDGIGVRAYGNHISSANATINNPTQNQIGLYLDWKLTGTDTGNKKWALYNASTDTTAGKMFMGLDNTKTYWGTGFDWSISASVDAQANLNITREVGTGKVNFGAAPILTTGTLGAGATTLTGALTIGTTTTGLNATLNATLGADIAPALEAADWTGTNGWSAGGGALTKVTNGTAGTITPSGAGATPTIGVTYKITIVCSAVGAPAVTYTYGGVKGTPITATTIVDYITAVTTGKLIITGAINSTATITSVSILPITASTGDLYAYGDIMLGGKIVNPNGSMGMEMTPYGVRMGDLSGVKENLFFDFTALSNGVYIGSDTGITSVYFRDPIVSFGFQNGTVYKKEGIYVAYNHLVLQQWTAGGTVAVMTSYRDNVVANTLYLKEGKVGILNITPSVELDVTGSILASGAITGTQFKLSALNTAPANATDTGTLGEIRWVDGYVYLCTDTNVWIRAALATW